MADEQIKVVYSVDTDEVRDAEKATESLRSATDRMADSVDKAEKSTRNFGRATLEGGRVLQDFAQGGIGGVLNNIEGLTVALGGGPGLAGVMTAVGLAAYFAGPPLKALWSSIVDGSNGVPESASRLDRMSEALKTMEGRLKELREKGWLTDKELSEYNDAMEKRVGLEKDVTAEKEKQAAFAKADKAAEAGKVNADAAKIAESVVAETGGSKAAVGRVARSMVESERKGGAIGGYEARQRELETFRARDHRAGKTSVIGKGEDGAVYEMSVDDFYNQLNRQYQAKIDAELDRIAKEAEDEVNAALQGDQDAASRMLGNDPTNVSRWIKATRGGMAYAERKKNAPAEAEARRKADEAARKAQDEARREIEDPIRKEAEERQAKALRDRSKTKAQREASFEARRKRLAGYEADDAENEKSTPEELRQSEAIEAIEKRGVGKDWTPEEWDRAAKEAVANRNAKVGGRESIDLAIRGVQAAREQRGDAADLMQYERRADAMTGGQLAPEQLQDVARRTQDLVRRNVDPMTAAQQAIGELLQANAELINTMQQVQSGFSAQAQQARWQRQQASQLRQMTPSILNRGGG